MRVVLAELAPVRGEPLANLRTLEATVRRYNGAHLIAFPELFLSGYRVGDQAHLLALEPGSPLLGRVQKAARRSGAWIVVGAPWRSSPRAGEIQNTAIWVDPSGSVSVQGKRFLPTFGPFEEGLHYAPGRRGLVLPSPWGKLGAEICYDVFFPEVSRDLAMGGADLLVILSASPVTSRPLFERLLPARAIENGLWVAYVNRTGVEDGLVFAGGSGIWTPQGVAVDPAESRTEGEDRVLSFDIEPTGTRRGRPFRPVLRDLGVAFPDERDPEGPRHA